MTCCGWGCDNVVTDAEEALMTLLQLAAASLLLFQPAPAATTGAPAPGKPAAAAAKSADVPVTVTYRGKGTVDAAHKIIVWVFADPNITSASRPVAHQIVTRNNETVTFRDLGPSPVYLFAVYDESGQYDGVSGPPPAGLPACTYRKTPKGAPAAVTPGLLVKFTFDDSERWNK
jgi:hypothetical protein